MKHLPLLLLLLSIAGCVSVPVMRLKPTATSTHWLMGREYATVDDGTVRVAAAFDRSASPRISFQVEITNRSDVELLVSPELFYAVVSGDSTGVVTGGEQVAAFDPEKEILEADVAAAREREGYQYQQIGDAVGQVIGAVGRLASDAEETERERRHREAEQAQRVRTRDSAHAETLRQLEADRQLWSSVLRRTTLRPGESVRGEIWFPARPEARSVQLVFPVGPSRNSLTFLQQKM